MADGLREGEVVLIKGDRLCVMTFCKSKVAESRERAGFSSQIANVFGNLSLLGEAFFSFEVVIERVMGAAEIAVRCAFH